MLNLELAAVQTILCLAAHSDDIEIGCGGTLLQLLESQPGLSVHSVILSACEERDSEAARASEFFLGKASASLQIKTFQDTFFPFQGSEIKEFIQQLSRDISPDLIFTHRSEDAHQDHRLIAELTWNAFRNHLILEYEIPKL